MEVKTSCLFPVSASGQVRFRGVTIPILLASDQESVSSYSVGRLAATKDIDYNTGLPIALKSC